MEAGEAAPRHGPVEVDVARAERHHAGVAVDGGGGRSPRVPVRQPVQHGHEGPGHDVGRRTGPREGHRRVGEGLWLDRRH